jgi:hypothetical protein
LGSKSVSHTDKSFVSRVGFPPPLNVVYRT